MAGIKVGENTVSPWRGDHKPVRIYHGANKIAGWEEATATGQSVTAGNTYNDAAHVEVQGNTELQSDYMECWGGSTQDGTPSPNMPIDITPLVTAGTYKITTDYGIYEVTVPDLHGIGDVHDKVVFDALSGNGYLDATCGNVIIDGIDKKLRKTDTTAASFLYHIYADNAKTAGMCSHFVHYDNYPSIYGKFSSSVADKLLFFCMKDLVSGDNATLPNADEANQWVSQNPITVVYQLVTPIRTPLTFTKVGTSTVPELPLHVFEDGTTTPPTSNMPSIDYPQTIVPASGTLTTSCGDNQSIQTIPPLYGIKNTDGTWAVRDKLVIDDATNTAWIERGVGVIAFDGTESWVNFALSSDGTIARSTCENIDYNVAINARGLCTHLARKGSAVTPTEIGFWFSGDNRILIALPVKTIEAFKAFLTAQHSAGTPVTVAYCATAPTIEPIEYTAAQTYYPQTVIDLTSNLPMDMTTTYKHF